MPNFSEILDRPASETERPKPLPAGTYTCVVAGLPEQGESAKKKTPYLRFLLRPLEAHEDVDGEALEAMGGLGNRTIRADYYLTEDSLFRLKDFIEHCGVEIPDGVKYGALIDQLPNCQVLAVVRHRATDDGSVYAELAKTAPAE